MSVFHYFFNIYDLFYKPTFFLNCTAFSMHIKCILVVIKCSYDQTIYIHSPQECSEWVACLWLDKMPMFRRAEMRKGGLPLPLTFQYLILIIWRSCDLNLVMISSLASKGQDFKLGLQFHFIKWLKNGHPNFKDLSFWSQI